MRSYEIVYLFSPELERQAVDAKLNDFHGELNGAVDVVHHWGIRPLAYPIQRVEQAYYAVAHVQTNPKALPEFERRLRLDEETMRYLVVLNEGQPTSGQSIRAEARRATVEETGEGGEEAEEAEEAGEEVEEVEEAEASESEDADEAAIGQESADASDAEPPETTSEAEEEEAAEGEADEDPDSEAEEEEREGGDEAPEAQPEARPQDPSLPPVFSGATGRRRRHEGPAILHLNYKDVRTLASFLSDQGKILPKRTTRVTARFQRSLVRAIKRARFLALLPYIREHKGVSG